MELLVHRGLRLTEPIRSLFFEMRYAASDNEAVQAADMAAYDDLVSRGRAAHVPGGQPRVDGGGPFRVAALDMDENAWSPTEVTMRRVWQHEAGLPRPRCNRPIFDLNGHHIGTPDLIDPVAGVVGEYNGALHLEGAQRATRRTPRGPLPRGRARAG